MFRAFCSDPKDDLQAFYFKMSVALTDVGRTTRKFFQLKKKLKIEPCSVIVAVLKGHHSFIHCGIREA